MSYINEINAFDRRMHRAPLSPMAQLLWYKLMQFSNRLHWPEDFQIENRRLMAEINVSALHTLIAARQELVDDGLLTFTPGVRGRPSIYRLQSVDALEGAYPVISGGDDTEDFLYEVKDDITTYFGYTEALGKDLQQTTEAIWKEFLPGEKPSEADAREVFYKIYQQDRDEEGTVTMRFPEDRKEMLAYAFGIARQSRKINWSYINGIYTNWGRHSLHTMQQIYDHEDARQQRRNCL